MNAFALAGFAMVGYALAMLGYRFIGPRLDQVAERLAGRIDERQAGR